MITITRVLGRFPASAAGALVLLGAAPSQAGFNAFVRFLDPPPGATQPEGQSEDVQFSGSKGWIEVSSFSQGILNTVTLGGASGAGTGKAQFSEFSFTKPPGPNSPILFQAVGAGYHYKTMDLCLRENLASGQIQKQPFYTLILKLAAIESLGWQGDNADDFPLESVTVRFGSMQFLYTQFDSKGTPLTTLNVNWDQVLNRGGDGLLSTVTAPKLSYPPAESVIVGGSETIQPSSGPSSKEGILSFKVKSTGGYTGGISLNTTTGQILLTDAKPLGGPYAIVTEIVDNLGLTTQASFNLTVSTIPLLIANPDELSRILGSGLSVPVAQLIGNDSAEAVFDGLLSESTALGGHISVSGATINYEPPHPDPGTDDSFSYRVRDGHGQSATGTVTVKVALPNEISAGNLAISVSDGGRALQLTGIPFLDYRLQTAPAVSGPWKDFGDVLTSNSDGVVGWFDASPDSPIFYRAYITQPIAATTVRK